MPYLVLFLAILNSAALLTHLSVFKEILAPGCISADKRTLPPRKNFLLVIICRKDLCAAAIKPAPFCFHLAKQTLFIAFFLKRL